MSDGREERNEQEERRDWEKRHDPDDLVDREERGDPEEAEEPRSSRAVEPEHLGWRSVLSPGDTVPVSPQADRAVMRESGRRTRRSFVAAAAAAAGGYGMYRWIDRSPLIGRQERPLRRALEANAALSRGVFDERGLTPTYPVERAVELRFNGPYGVREEMVPESYRLQVVGVENAAGRAGYVPDINAWEYKMKAIPETAEQGDSKGPKLAKGVSSAWTRSNDSDGKPMRGQEEAGESDTGYADGPTPGLLLTLADVTGLPRHELVTEFKCIEGWSQIVHWSGVRLADFLEAYPPAKTAAGREPRFVSMETPLGDYYCGYDMSACRHPQSLLVTEMGGQPLTQNHGAPLRLHMPIKYGYKQIKRIGLIAYTDTRPDDYWTKLGYDWYAGL